MFEPLEAVVQARGFHRPFLNVYALALCDDLQINPKVR